MHAGPKSKTPIGEEEREAQKQRECETKTMVENFFSERKHIRINVSAEEKQSRLWETENLLRKLPECYAIYNFRRELLLDGLTTSASSRDLLMRELKLNTEVMKADYKCYAAFAHRQWIYETLLRLAYDGSDERMISKMLEDICVLLEKELRQCESFLHMDERNFHVWNYRRWVLILKDRVVPTIPNPQKLSDENDVSSSCFLSHFLNDDEHLDFLFTTKKITENFSNYSAWHQRSLIFQRVLRKFHIAQPERDYGGLYCLIADDVDLLCQAIYCDPNDQASWFYAPLILQIYLTFEEKFNISFLHRSPVLKKLIMFEGDIVDFFVSSVIDLIVEEASPGDVYLPHSFFLLLLNNLLYGRLCQLAVSTVTDEKNESSSNEKLYARAHKYASWMMTRLNLSEADPVEERCVLTESCALWLESYLRCADASRAGMYQSLSKGTLNALHWSREL